MDDKLALCPKQDPGLSGISSARMDDKNWLVREKLCQKQMANFGLFG